MDRDRRTQTISKLGQFVLSENEASRFTVDADEDSSELGIKCDDLYLTREVSEFSATKERSCLYLLTEDENEKKQIMIASPTGVKDRDAVAVVHRGKVFYTKPEHSSAQAELVKFS